jgi:hypothetical protein
MTELQFLVDRVESFPHPSEVDRRLDSRPPTFLLNMRRGALEALKRHVDFQLYGIFQPRSHHRLGGN